MRAAVVVAAVLLIVLGPSPAADADPAGPTDYRSAIVSVDPPAPGVDLTMIGGDAFLHVAVEPGTSVEVIGYRGEPYLRFGDDGVVEINDNSPSTYLSEDRYAETEIPGFAAADAEPAWRVVARDGVYAWHDHRSHWMNQSRPAGAPGDQILEAVVPIVVDGVETDVTVISTWQEPPPVLPAALGAVLGALMGLIAARTRSRATAIVLITIAVLAAVVSWLAYAAVPPETGPSVVPVVAAVLAGGLALVGMLLPRIDRTLGVIAPALILSIWALLRRDWVFRSILPTTAPTMDRFVTSLVLMTSGVLVIAGVYRVLTAARVAVVTGDE